MMMTDQAGLAGRLLRQWESPPTWLLLFAALLWMQARFLPVLDAGRVGIWLGGALVLAGLGLMAASLVQFARARTTVMPRETASTMLTVGVYRWSRNPIYLADALMLAGLALFWDAAGLLLVPVFMTVIWWRFIRGEEAGLLASFGPEFTRFAARTRRWL